MNSWKRNFVAVWCSQFLSIMGFSFSIPFAPYYLQELGVSDPGRLALWVSLFNAATPLGLIVSSPLWGGLADRYGRRPMLMRANFAAAVVLALMAVVSSPFQLVALRLAQGFFTGTMTAAQTMVSVQAPMDRRARALGILTAAVFSGGMIGSALGGWISDAFGYRTALALSSWLLLGAGALVVFGTTERFVPPADDSASGADQPAWSLVQSCGSLLLLIGTLSFVGQFDRAFLPLLVQEIHGSLEGAARWSGGLASAAGAAGLVSGFVIGRAADRRSPGAVAAWCALGTGALVLTQGCAHGFGLLFLARSGAAFCGAGLDPVLQAWLARITPDNRRGQVFGWAGTARSIGWFAAPLASGVTASAIGVRGVFAVGAALFLAVVPVIVWLARRGEAPAPAAAA